MTTFVCQCGNPMAFDEQLASTQCEHCDEPCYVGNCGPCAALQRSDGIGPKTRSGRR